MEIILGSVSPRRKEILNYFSLPFRQIASTFDEERVVFTGSPAQYVQDIALAKGRLLSGSYPDALIITADTTVYIDGQILGKPKNEQEVYSMLSTLSGRWHSVFTAIALTHRNQPHVEVEETKVLCNVLTCEDIQRTCKKHTPFDKAGAYTIQQSSSLIVKQIDGCYYNVLGLPINSLKKLLHTYYNIDLWDFIG